MNVVAESERRVWADCVVDAQVRPPIKSSTPIRLEGGAEPFGRRRVGQPAQRRGPVETGMLWCAVAVLFLVCAAAAVVIIAPPARANPVALAPQHYTKHTRDGWDLTISIDNEVVNSVPNLAAAANSREAFVTLSATASARGGSVPITDSVFITGYQLGCQSDVSSGLGMGAAIAGGNTEGLPAGNTSTGLGATGFMQLVVQPGVIVDLPLVNMALNEGGDAMLDVDNIHVKVDACGGDVTIRSYAYLRISTSAAHSEFAVYGDPIKI